MSKETFNYEPESEGESSENYLSEETTPPERSPQEIQELKNKLRFISRVLSENFNLEIIPGERWAAGTPRTPGTPRIITYPEGDLLEKSEDYIFGVLRHEVGHLKRTNYESLVELQGKAKDEGYNPQDFLVIENAWEDGRINNLEAQDSQAARYRIGVALKESMADELLRDYDEKPLPVQYAVLTWAKGAESFIEGFDFEEFKAKIKDEAVLKAYEETEEILDEYIKESEGQKALQEILWEKGWPIFKRLVDKYIEEEAARIYIVQPQIQQEEEGETKTREEQRRPEDWDSLSEEQKEQFRKQARQKLNEEEQKLIEILQPKSTEIKEREDSLFEVVMVPVSSEDIERAKQEEQRLEQEERERQQQIQNLKAEETERLEESLESLRIRETELTKEEREQYEQYYSLVKKYVNLLVERLDEVFPPQIEEWEGGFRRGKRIDIRNLAREIPTERGRFFEKKEIPEIREVAFSLLLDASSSMRGEKIQEAVKAAILMAEALSKKRIPFEIIAFHHGFVELKQFGEEYTGRKKKELMTILESLGYATDLSFSVDSAARRLQKQLLDNDASGALIVFTDGAPSPIPEHSGPKWELKRVIERWSKRIPLVGVGIGPEMEIMIKHYFGQNGLTVPDINKLPQALLNILRKQISRFEKESPSQ